MLGNDLLECGVAFQLSDKVCLQVQYYLSARRSWYFAKDLTGTIKTAIAAIAAFLCSKATDFSIKEREKEQKRKNGRAGINLISLRQPNFASFTVNME